MCERHERLFLHAFQRLFFRDPRIGRKLLEEAGSAQSAFESERARFRPLFGRRQRLFDEFARPADLKRAEADLQVVERIDGRIISILDSSYPALLKNIYDAPSVLIAAGDAKGSIDSVAIAVVGSRKATGYGRDAAATISEGLAALGITVVSGMAYGIDSAAHGGALRVGGPTVAVLGCGPDVVYPPSNRELAERIICAGCMLSEFPPGEPPMPKHFPQRNRIISGLTVATVVVEAEERSGSLITARFALEQGRDVMAVPGPAMAPRSRGTNRLIRDGAQLIESVADISEALQPLVATTVFSESSGHLKNDTGNDSPIFGVLSRRRARGVDELATRSGLPVSKLLEDLTRLSLDGLVEELPGRRWRLKERDG